MARYDEATFELAKKLRAKAVQRLREEGFDAEDRTPRGTPAFRPAAVPTDASETPTPESGTQQAIAPAVSDERDETANETRGEHPTQGSVAHVERVEAGLPALEPGSAFGLTRHDYTDAVFELKNYPGGSLRAPWIRAPILGDHGHGRSKLYEWGEGTDGIVVEYGKPSDSTMLTVFVSLHGRDDDGQRPIPRRT